MHTTLPLIHREDRPILAVFLMDYHNGMWSRGYRLLSRMRLGGNWSSRFCAAMRQEPLYKHLELNYAHKV